MPAPPSGPIAEFAAPDRFWCLDGFPEQAQVTIGWSVPTAKAVSVSLDGEELHSGIRKRLPYAVPAGEAPGIGSTVVFPCEPEDEHEIGISWDLKGKAKPVEQKLKISKAAAPDSEVELEGADA